MKLISCSLFILFSLLFLQYGCGHKATGTGSRATAVKTAKDSDLGDFLLEEDGTVLSGEALVPLPSPRALARKKKVEAKTDEVAPAEEGIYLVERKGQHLMAIAQELFGRPNHWRKLALWNKKNISSQDVLPVGTKLVYRKDIVDRELKNFVRPEGEPYKIRRGDTLSKIAFQLYHHGRLWKELWENNKILFPDPNLIFGGLILYYKNISETKPDKK